jgi:hypothetical protein
MTRTIASRRETPVALLFGENDESQKAAAELGLGPLVRNKLGVLSRLPETIRDGAIAAVITATMALLQFDMIELLVDGWREHHDLTDAARHTLAKPQSTELVALATHRITVSRLPSVDLLLNDECVETVEFELTIQFDISAAVAGVSAGMMTALHSGRCDITVTLAIQGAEAIQRQKRIDLPGVISLKHGIRLLDEEDYAKARSARTGATTELSAGSVEPETVRIDAIEGTEAGSTAQPI